MTPELIIIAFILIVIGILITRYLELTPQIIFRIMARSTNEEVLQYLRPEDLELSAELVEFRDKTTPLIAWFFPSNSESKTSILMIPNWYLKQDHENNLKTAGVLQKAGYNVLLPIYYWDIKGKVSQKRRISPKACQRIINGAYRYLCSRSDVDRRNIAIWSNSAGTILACKLVEDYPIKSIVLEDGPITIWDEFADYLNHKKNFPFSITKITLKLFLWPTIWRTKWQSKHAIKSLRSCPSFLIATREDSRKEYWKTFTYLHRPKQFWYEHGLPRGGVRELWNQEYFIQVRTFYDNFFNLQTTKPDFHYEMSSGRKKKGKYPFQIRMTSMPPQMDKIPLQIIFLHKGNKLSEYRIWFSGASLQLNHSCDDKPLNVIVHPFYNVTPYPGDSTGRRLWLKKEANTALDIAIQELLKYPLHYLPEITQRYFFIKSIILQEHENCKDARLSLDKLHSKYWNRMINKDPDSRAIRFDSKDKAVSDASLPVMTH